MQPRHRTTHQLRIAACAALVLVAISAHAQDWKTYSYAADGFSASFPSAPEAAKQDVDTEGGPIELRTYLATDGNVALFVGVSDYGPNAAKADPDAILQGAKNGALTNAKATLASEKPITLGTYHGLEFEADSAAGHISARIYVVNGFLYQTLVITPPSSSYANRTRFLDSFQLIAQTKNG